MKPSEKKHYRLGIDMGSTSIGWCMLELDNQNNPCGIINMGVRIFPDGRDDKSKEPLSVSRRTYRGMRRNLDRYLDRRNRILEFFDRNGFLPRENTERRQVFLKDPVELRKETLDKQLALSDIARAIIHLAKRRGFKSNRKTGEAKDTEFMEAIRNLDENLQKHGARSLGEYLWMRNKDVHPHEHHKKMPAKFRYEKGLSEEERIFPTRLMVETEFDLIWDTQARYNPKLTQELKQELKNIIFYQRPLKKQLVGKCTYERDEDRCLKAHPLFQEFRLRQDVNQLELLRNSDNQTREITSEERSKLYEFLNEKDKAGFDRLRKLILGKEAEDFHFNYETENKKYLQGNLTNHAFLKSKELAPIWQKTSDDKQGEIIRIIMDDELSDEAAEMVLMDKGLSSEQALLALNVRLPKDHGSLSLKAIKKILPYLRQGEKYYKACELAGYKGDRYNGLVFDELPYYGEIKEINTLPLQRKTHDASADEYGKIGNPTVHIALNQLRRIMNKLTSLYGPPFDVSLELARDSAPPVKLVNSLKEQLGIKIPPRGVEQDSMYKQYQSLIKRIQAKNTAFNEHLDAELQNQRIPVNSENRLKLKLWEELAKDDFNRCCVYCGKIISREEIFKPHIQIEHILPKSRTYDDSYANKTISHLECNIKKGEKSPYEAFSDSPGIFDWEAICERSKLLPVNKRWRFNENAMDNYEKVDADGKTFLDRMLNDTRYMSKAAAQYLQYTCGKKVTPVTGKLTEELRRKWGLNKMLGDADKKERTDHRHHAIDAFIIAMTDRSLVQRYANAVKSSPDRFLKGLELPYDGFSHADMKEKVDRITVSYKPDQPNPSKLRGRNQTAGGLVKETAYSFLVPDPDNPKYGIYCVRQDVTGLSPKDISDIRDDTGFVKKQLSALWKSCGDDEKEFKAKLPAWAEQHNIKKVRLMLKANPETMIPVRDKNGRIYKYYASDENLYADIYDKARPGKEEPRWEMEIVSSYKAHLPEFKPEWKQKYPWAKLIMRLYKNDVVAFTNAEGKRELRRVKKMTYGIIYLRELNVAKKPKGMDDIGEAFTVNQLRIKNASKAGIDEIGRFFDPAGAKDAGDRAK